MKRLQNAYLSLGFDETTGLLTHLRDVEGDVSHLAPPENPFDMWKLTFRAGADEQYLVPPGRDANVSVVVRRNGNEQNAVIRWGGITFQNEPNALDVTVAISLPDDSAKTEWRIMIDNHSTHYGLWQVTFPWFNGWPGPGEYDVAVPRHNWGIVYERADLEMKGEYSCASWPMQFLAFLTQGRGLYIGAHDEDQHFKKFLVEPGTGAGIELPAPDAAKPGTKLEDPYPVSVQIFSGGWIEGTKIYREWALQQKWTSKGPLTTREDTPKQAKDIGLWLRDTFPAPGDEMTPEEWADDIVDVAKFYDVPIGVHIYCWHEIPFDNIYPEYFPAKPGFKEAVRKLVDAGILAMPYINARIWDTQAPSYPEAFPFTAKDQVGVPHLELYSPQAGRLVPMCTHTEFWQKKVLEICERLIDEFGVNGIYLDQIGAAGPVLCFDESHGHTLGGGTWWHDGYRKMLNGIKEMIARKDRPVTLTTENPGEAHIDGIDGFLIWMPRWGNEVPMITAVYSGYALYFSSPQTLDQGFRAWAMTQGRDFLWGAQLGWMQPKMPPEFMDYLRTLGKLRVASRDFLTYGELVGELTPIAAHGNGAPTDGLPARVDPPYIEGAWWDWKKPKLEKLPAVMSSVWRANKCRMALFIANLSDAEREYHYAWDPESFGLRGSNLHYTPIGEQGLDGPGETVEGGIQIRSEKLPAYGVAVYEVRNAQRVGDSH